MKINAKNLKPVAMNVAAATAGVVAAGYAKPEIENALGASVGQYADEIVTAAGVAIAAYSGGQSASKKLIRNFSIGMSIRGAMGLLDKYVFKKTVHGQGDGNKGMQGVPLALEPASVLDQPVEVIDFEAQPEVENAPEGEFQVSIV